jgi:hypothetical protein
MYRRKVLSIAATSFALSGCAGVSSENEGNPEKCPRISENPTVCESNSNSDGDILFYPERDIVERNTATIDLVLENGSRQTFNYDDLRVYGRTNDEWKELLSGTIFQGQTLLPAGELQTWSLKVAMDRSQSQYEYGDCDSILLYGGDYEAYAFALGGKLQSDDERKDYVATLGVASQ